MEETYQIYQQEDKEKAIRRVLDTSRKLWHYEVGVEVFILQHVLCSTKQSYTSDTFPPYK